MTEKKNYEQRLKDWEKARFAPAPEPDLKPTKPSFVNQVSLRFSIFREGFPENSVNSSTGNTAATGAEG